jgi:hypothetical protein
MRARPLPRQKNTASADGKPHPMRHLRRHSPKAWPEYRRHAQAPELGHEHDIGVRAHGTNFCLATRRMTSPLRRTDSHAAPAQGSDACSSAVERRARARFAGHSQSSQAMGQLGDAPTLFDGASDRRASAWYALQLRVGEVRHDAAQLRDETSELPRSL